MSKLEPLDFILYLFAEALICCLIIPLERKMWFKLGDKLAAVTDLNNVIFSQSEVPTEASGACTTNVHIFVQIVSFFQAQIVTA